MLTAEDVWNAFLSQDPTFIVLFPEEGIRTAIREMIEASVPLLGPLIDELATLKTFAQARLIFLRQNKETKLIEKFNSAPELMQFLESRQGKELVDSIEKQPVIAASDRIIARADISVPRAILARKSALAGATSIRSRSRESSMCDMLSAIRGSQRSVQTVWPVRACMVTGVTKRVAASVMATRTSQPALPSRRASSAAL